MILELAVGQKSFQYQYQAMEDSAGNFSYLYNALKCYVNSLLYTWQIPRIFCISAVRFCLKPPVGIHVVLVLVASPAS